MWAEEWAAARRQEGRLGGNEAAGDEEKDAVCV